MSIKLDQIEGATPLDPNEIDGLIPSYISTQGQLNAAEQVNIAEARVWAMGKNHDDVLSDSFIRDLHKRMFKDVWRWAGIYRKTEKNIGVDPRQVAIQVRDLCSDAAYWIQNQTYFWDEIGARFHHRLVLIHPFPNGNGRHARLATDVLMNVHRQPMFTWGGNAEEARNRYLVALKAADRNQFTELLKFVRAE